MADSAKCGNFGAVNTYENTFFRCPSLLQPVSSGNPALPSKKFPFLA
jgi:hypothetical protein